MNPYWKIMRWTISKAVIEWSVDPKTLKQKLAATGKTFVKGDTFSTLEICAALYGDKEREQTLEIVERRKALERDNRIADRELIPLEENLAWQEKVLLPMRQRIIALPGVMAQRCSPADPDFSRVALTEWVKETMPLLRAEIAKAVKQ